MNIVLASTSPYKKELLSRVVDKYNVAQPLFNEDHFDKTSLSPKQLSQVMAKKKAQSLISSYPDTIILGADQVVSFQDEVLSKPREKEKAIEQLSKLSGNKHSIFTSCYIYHPSQDFMITDITSLYMRNLSKKAIESYIDKDSPLNCAGSYMLEKSGVALFEKIESNDQSAIVGLPLIEITTALIKLGFTLFKES